MNLVLMNQIPDDVMNCSFATLYAMRDQIPADRWEQIKQDRPDFAAWLAMTSDGSTTR